MTPDLWDQRKGVLSKEGVKEESYRARKKARENWKEKEMEENEEKKRDENEATDILLLLLYTFTLLNWVKLYFV